MDKLLFLLIMIGCAVNCGALLLFKIQSRGDRPARQPGPREPQGQHAEPGAEADQFWAALLNGDAAR